MTKIPAILDTDIGSDIDDTWALAMILGCPELEPKLIVTTSGDTVYRAHLAAKFLQVSGHMEIPIGIGLGDSGDEHRYQLPWLEGFDINDYPGIIHQDGVQAMIDTIMASREPVTIISIAAATNIARALELEPRIASKCRFIGMHGSIHLGYGGVPGATPEANVRLDVPALRKVFATPWLEIVVTPLDTCGLVELTGEAYQKILHSTDPMLKALIENYHIWARLVTWVKVDFDHVKSSTLFDTVAVYLAYNRDLLKVEPIRLRITDDGLTLPDPDGDLVLAALHWHDLDGFYRHLVERLGIRETA
jgi:inosine-uridine nucleoside N-ribohydrolase